MNFSAQYLQTITPQILEGLTVTLRLFILTLVLSLPLGLILSLGRVSKIKPLNWIIQLYLLIFRGTPLLLQLFFIYFGLPFMKIHLMGGATFSFVLSFVINIFNNLWTCRRRIPMYL